MTDQQEFGPAKTGLSTQTANADQISRISDINPMTRYKRLIRLIPDLLYYLDKKGHILWICDPAGILDYPDKKMMDRSFFDFVHPRDTETAQSAFMTAVDGGESAIRRQKIRLVDIRREIRSVEITSLTHFDESGRFIAEEGICRDLTEFAETEATLMTVHAKLEKTVKMRTHALSMANEELEREIAERTITEEMLRQREIELENEKASLQRANTALKVLLKRRTEDRTRIEKEVLYNIKKLVMPYLRKIRSTDLNERQQAYLGILESNLDELPLAFSRKLSLKHYNLTPAEIRVANLIRKGRTTREIAHALVLSKRTIDNHRQNIRKKLCIQNKRVNLRTYLLSIT